MGHSRPDTTQACTDEVDLEEFAAALDRAPWNRHAQASSGWATDRATHPDETETPGVEAAGIEPSSSRSAHRMGFHG